MASRHSMDLTEGSVLKKLILFVIPIMLSNLLQQVYHAADVIVVGNFALDSKISLAAVGSTSSVSTLLINLFLGLSLGANVVCANLCGAKREKELKLAIETSLIVAAVSGVFIGIVGFIFAGPILRLMAVPENILPHAVTYMRIIFLGQPGSIVYNFGAGILRSHGDTKRPMYILSAAGIVNVILNLVFVIVFHLDSAGVAIATIVSHYLSAAAVLFVLASPKGDYGVDLFRLRFDRSIFFKIVRIGIPGGLNGMVFSVSNVIISRTVFQLGDVAVAGSSAASSLTNLIFQINSAFYTACVGFAGQNYGAKKLGRIDRLLWQSIVVSSAILLVVAVAVSYFATFFLGLFSDDPEVVIAAKPQLVATAFAYVIYTVSEMTIGCSRGMGKSVLPTALNALMICGPRIVWVFLFVPMNFTLGFIYLCYPISYVFSGAAQLICYFYYMKKEKSALKSADMNGCLVT